MEPQQPKQKLGPEINRRNFLRLLGLSSAASLMPEIPGAATLQKLANTAQVAADPMRSLAELMTRMLGGGAEATATGYASKIVATIDRHNRFVPKGNGKDITALDLAAVFCRAFDHREHLPGADLLEFASKVTGLEYAPGKNVGEGMPGFVTGNLFFRWSGETAESWEGRVRENLRFSMGPTAEMPADLSHLMRSLEEREKLLDILVEIAPQDHKTYSILVRQRNPNLVTAEGALNAEGRKLASRMLLQRRLPHIENSLMFSSKHKARLAGFLDELCQVGAGDFSNQVGTLIRGGVVEELRELPAVKIYMELEDILRKLPTPAMLRKMSAAQIFNLHKRCSLLRDKLTSMGFDDAHICHGAMIDIKNAHQARFGDWGKHQSKMPYPKVECFGSVAFSGATQYWMSAEGRAVEYAGFRILADLSGPHVAAEMLIGLDTFEGEEMVGSNEAQWAPLLFDSTVTKLLA